MYTYEQNVQNLKTEIPYRRSDDYDLLCSATNGKSIICFIYWNSDTSNSSRYLFFSLRFSLIWYSISVAQPYYLKVQFLHLCFLDLASKSVFHKNCNCAWWCISHFSIIFWYNVVLFMCLSHCSCINSILFKYILSPCYLMDRILVDMLYFHPA